MWTYSQRTGDLWHHPPDGPLRYRTPEDWIATGYSGHGEGLNNPAVERVPSVGPIPRGRWTIGAPYDSSSTGPYTLRLTPDSSTDTFGRSAFRIHGDNRLGDRSASHGCIVLPRVVRELIHESCDNELEVVD
jgi:hypothetical protein